LISRTRVESGLRSNCVWSSSTIAPGLDTARPSGVPFATRIRSTNGTPGILTSKRARGPYPAELRLNIIEANFAYLSSHPFSFRNQLAKAIDRSDAVSIEHRVTSWLSSYFDVLFAINSVPHPGEKDLLDRVNQECKFVPEGFQSAMHQLLAGTANTHTVLTVMDQLVERLRDLLRQQNLLQ
jgi:hypothetical protein